MLTEFGKFCRKLRIDHNELLKNMADKLGVTPAYLSAVEIGKRNIPQHWIQQLSSIYYLNNEQIANLKEAARLSEKQVKIDLAGYSNDDRDFVLSFAREFKSLDPDIKDQLKVLLRRQN